MQTSTLSEALNRACTLMQRGNVLSGEEIAVIVRLLIEHEVAAGGPYSATAGGTTPDPLMSIRAAHFLYTQDVCLPKLDAYIIELPPADPQYASDLGLLHHNRSIVRRHTLPQVLFTLRESEILKKLLSAMEFRLAGVGAEVAGAARRIIMRTLRGNPDKQMTLMPYYLREALGERGKVFTDTHIGELGFVNACFWSSFIVYDDFWDEDESAEARLLPAANLLTRIYVQYFDLLAANPSFNTFFHALMDKLDAANAWETVHCRMRVEAGALILPDEMPLYGDFGIKFYPAAGHVVGLVALLAQLGYGAQSPQTTALIEYCAHYLVGMQLNDDAHDWKEDLTRGHISTTVALLLATWKQQHPEQDRINLIYDMPELEQLFWSATLDQVCKEVLKRSKRAHSALTRIDIIADVQPLAQFIERNTNIAEKAMRERARSKAFVSGFSAKPLSDVS